MSVKNHYDSLLGSVYSWMTGDFKQRVEEQKDYFLRHGVNPGAGSAAFDLGCGHGIQSVALADMGYNVFAFDFCSDLLEELKANTAGRSITPIESDMVKFDEYTGATPELVVCMGDTMTHLGNIAELDLLVNRCYEKLGKTGMVILSFRDLTKELYGTDRFIPVKSDENRILTCFLEYFSDHVMVHDILHEKNNSQWIQRVSAYKKIKISGEYVTSLLEKTGFKILSCETVNRMLYLTAVKPLADQC